MSFNNMQMQALQNALQMSQQRKPLVEFRAGICTFNVAETTVTPDKRKGKVVITQNPSGGLNFQWKLRPSGTCDWERILFPKSATWEKVPECTTGRCFLLRFKEGTAQRKLQFFWMQEPKDDKDEEYFKKINEIIETPPAPAANPLGAMGGMGGMGGMGAAAQQAQLMSMFGQQGGTAAAHQHRQPGFPTGTGNTGASGASGASTNTAAQATAQNNANANNERNMRDALLASMSSFLGNPQMQATARLNLNDIMDTDRVMAALGDDDVARLLEYLPESQRDAYNMRATLRSPQIQQTGSRLSSILNGPQFNAMMASMNLPHAGTLGVGAFLDSIQSEADKQKEEEKKKQDSENKKNDDAQNNEGAKKKR